MMGRAKAAMQGGFLLMIFLVSGISALRCYSATYVLYNTTHQLVNFGLSDNSITCKNACMEAHVTLKIDHMVLLVISRGCANRELDGAGSNSSGDPHYSVDTSVRYCFTDLCNQEKRRMASWTTGDDTVPEESSSNKCYSGLVFSPKSALDKVVCRTNYSQCYQGHGIIQTGHMSMSVLISTCQQLPCIAPKNQSNGPFQLRLWGSCCNGTYCNMNNMSVPGYHNGVTFIPISSVPEQDADHGRERESSVPGLDAHLLDPPFQPIPPKEDSMLETDPSEDKEKNKRRLLIQAEAVRFQSCPTLTLLIAMGTVLFGGW